MTDETNGSLTVEIDSSDIQHLMTHGTSVVTKDIGPIQVKIACRDKMRAAVIASGPDKDPEEME